DAMRTGRRRSIGLGRADGRWFTFAAGFGFDAEVVRRVERRRRAGDGPTDSRYVRTAVAHFLARYDRRHPAITLERPGAQPEHRLYYVLVSNTSPWTYLGDRPVRPTPDASFSSGLDLLAPRTMRTLWTLRLLRQAFRRRPRLRSRRLLQLHDLSSFTLRADRPMAPQV